MSGLTWDADSHLFYAQARWYDPVSGKFIGEDLLRFGAGDIRKSLGASSTVSRCWSLITYMPRRTDEFRYQLLPTTGKKTRNSTC